MNIEKPPKVDKLETKYRDLLQVALIKKVLGENSTSEQRFNWIEENAERISNFIDSSSEQAKKIRELAREEKYEEAAEFLKDLL